MSRPITSSNSSQFPKKQLEWISSLIQRYQDQLPTNTGRPIDRETRQLLDTTHSCIINVSKNHLQMVVVSLVRVLKAVNASRWTSELALTQSRLIVMETLLECLNEAEGPLARRPEREACMGQLVEEMWQVISSCAPGQQVHETATAIVARVGALYSTMMIAKLDVVLEALRNEETPDDLVEDALKHLSMMSYVTYVLCDVIKILNQVLAHYPVRKEYVEPVCVMLSCVIWKWIEANPDQFGLLQHSAHEQLSDACDRLFMVMNSIEMRRRAICWPVQMLLIAVSPCSLELIAHAEGNQTLAPAVQIKHQFLESIIQCLNQCAGAARPVWSGQLQYACHAAVFLCKSATYVNLSDYFVFNIVQQLIGPVKTILLGSARPRDIDRGVIVDLLVSLFRLKFDNDMFRLCLNASQPTLQLVLIEALLRISVQRRLHWWPKIDMVWSRSDDLRKLLMNCIEKVLETDPIAVSSGHLPISVSRSWQKMSVKWRVERGSTQNLSPDGCSHQTLLVAILKLINTQPYIMIRQRPFMNPDDPAAEPLGYSDPFVESVVSALVLLVDHATLHTNAMQALLALHEVIPQWNCRSKAEGLATFFSVGSHMLFAVCQKLLHFQISNAEHVITWLRAIMTHRIAYLRLNAAEVTEEFVDVMTAQSLVKFEAVALLYLWSCDADLVLCCLSLFGLHCAHASLISGVLHSSLAAHLAAASESECIVTAGRVALQKSVYRCLRSLPQTNAASTEAWHESYRVWELFTAHLVAESKDHADFVEHVTRVAATPAGGDLLQSTVDVWSNMSGFLCSFAHLIYANEQNQVTTFLNKLLQVLRTDQPQATLRDAMTKTVKELISFEMDYSLDHFILHTISCQLAQHSSNGQFIEHVIYILSNMLSRRAVVVLKTESTIQILSALLSHSEQMNVRMENLNHLTDTTSTKSGGSSSGGVAGGSSLASQKSLTLIKKLSGLITLILGVSSSQRIPATTQSRLIDHFTNLLASFPAYSNSPLKSDSLLALLGSIGKLLSTLSVSPSGAAFNRLFNLLVDTFHHSYASSSPGLASQAPQLVSSSHTHLVSSSTPSSNDPLPSGSIHQISSLLAEPGSSCAEAVARIDDAALTTLAALVNGNPELGIGRLVEAGWSGDIRLHGYMLEALCRVLSSKTGAGGTLGSSSELNAQQSELLKLITLITDDGALPMVNALANALPNEYMDHLSRVLVTTFSERHLLSELLWTVLWKEAEGSMSPSTLFRGSSLAAKIIGYCFRVFGHAYLMRTLAPLFHFMLHTPDRSYEIEQDRLSSGAAAESGIQATTTVAEMAFQLILQSEAEFPGQLRTVCHSLYHVINARFPNAGLSALGKILFLRFFNPVIVSPYENQMISKRPTRSMSRGLTLVSKILQTTVNQPTFSKEWTMSHFQQLIASKQAVVNNFLSSIALNDSAVAWLESATLVPSINLPLLYSIHSLFSMNRCEIIRNLRLHSAHSNLCSRIDVLLQALPDNVPNMGFSSFSSNLEALSGETVLPCFYAATSGTSSPPVYVLVLRRIVTADVDALRKQIDDKCAKTRFVCVVDCLFCEYPPSLTKILSLTVLKNVERLVVPLCSPKILTQLGDAVFAQVRVDFGLSSVDIASNSIPSFTALLLHAEPSFCVKANLISANDAEVTVKLIDKIIQIERVTQWRAVGDSTTQATVSDLYMCAAFEQIELIDARTITFVVGDNSHVFSLALAHARRLVEKIGAIRVRSSSECRSDTKVQLRANCDDVTALAVVRLVDADANVRSTAYRLLNNLSLALNLPISARLQDTPCVFIPTNCSRFIAPILSMLVENQPTLLLSLVPKIIQHGNPILVGCLRDCWAGMQQLDGDQLQDLFAHLVASTSTLGAGSSPVGPLMLTEVWPVIGAEERILLALLEHLLSSPYPLAHLCELVQALVCMSNFFASTVIVRLLEELSATASTEAEDWKSLPKLLAFLLVLSFNAEAINVETQLPNIMHVVTCLAGSGSKFMRYAIFAIVSNVFHSFGSNPQTELCDDLRRCLSIFLRQLSNEEALRLFNVDEMPCGQAVLNGAMKMMNIEDEIDLYGRSSCDDASSTDQQEKSPDDDSTSLSNVHQLITLLMAIVGDLEKGSTAETRDWLGEWRNISRQWAFRSTATTALQIRSLIAYSCLANTVSDSDIRNVIATLVAVVKRRDSLTCISGVTLALIRLHTLTPSNSPVHRLVFWIVILLFQLEHATVYEYAIQLLHTNLLTLDHMGVFEHTTIEQVAMDARHHLEWDLKALDQYAGLSFRANFNFALVGYLLKGLRQPFLCPKVLQLLHLVLRITAKTKNKNPYVLTMDNIPYIIALLPFDEKVQQRFRLGAPGDTQTAKSVLPPLWASDDLRTPNAAAENPTISVWNEDEEEETAVLLDPTIICGEQAQSLTVTVLAILARSCPNVSIVLDYLLEAVTVFPTVVPVIECLLDQRIVSLVQGCHSARMLSTVVRLIETSALEDSPSGATPQQVCSFLQQSGFAGLWRYAGAFLNPRASRQAINANLCSCLECIANLCR
ncbi:hypothetical protein QR680_012659 [Steinernema hermaphroditum]|uniref:Ras-GAP domain-containing protein n=1 Tax=Steinernema hermaphroditum TaxID=289476 RepID=A0AA39M147_9BILA|nr:hypothetical protein QR680_012659 [Steinernema hermaphroditum]